MHDLSPEEYQALLRQYFYLFIQRCFYALNPQAQFLPSWFIELIAAKLMDCIAGRIRRLIINVPPRHLKSLCASIAFPAFCLGHDPTARIMCVSYGQELSEKLARDTRIVMTSPWYRWLFPGTRLSPVRHAVQEFVTTMQGYRFATSIGGVVTGRGADIIIIDDPLKPEEAISGPGLKRVNDYFDHTLYSRLDDKATGCIIIIMQRLHLDDLVGHVLEREPWEVVSPPAIAEVDEAFEIETPFGTRRFCRKPGDLLHPEREPQHVLDTTRQTLGLYSFAGQYQQSPVPFGGGMIKTEWLRYYELHQLPSRYEKIIQSWDTASKVGEINDYSVCTTWGVWNKDIYLLDVFRKRLNYPDLKRAVRELQERFRSDIVLIEDRSSGTQLIQEFRTEGLYAVKACEPEGEKKMRLYTQTAMIENGFVHLPKDAHWLAEYVQELTSFPQGKYDDQVDSTSQALNWIKGGIWRDGTAIIEHYRRELEKMYGPEYVEKLDQKHRGK